MSRDVHETLGQLDQVSGRLQRLLEFERSLLATMMLRPADCWRVNITAEHFSSEQHGEILQAMRSRAADSLPIDPVSMCDHFDKARRKDLVALALNIGSSATTTAAPEAFANQITGAWRQRKVRDIGAMLSKSSDDKAVDNAIAQVMNLHAVETNHEWSSRDAAREAYRELQNVHLAGGKLPGVTTGLIDLDQKLGGFHPGDLVIIGGRAAMGKTSALIGMAQRAAAAGEPVGMISGEQPVGQVAMRMMSSASRVDAKLFRTADFADEEWARVYDASTSVADLPIWYLDRSAPTLGEVIRVARRWKHQHGIKALYVDYLQRIAGDGERKHEQVAFVARGLKNLARDLEIPVIALAQVNRDVETRANKEPKMADLSDSSEIEKEADQVLMLFRPGYYDVNEKQHYAKIIVDKNRHGPTGFVHVAWFGKTMTFDNWSGHDEDEPS